ncbi:MAG: 1-acyl-sn-glycerol-3-phosphate acyltransferase [Desulfobacteraceae bacterium]|nr:1-acyl-sn-glycerol-3-phosphate acyltransferase [Desulfobacteraceae bacterium]
MAMAHLSPYNMVAVIHTVVIILWTITMTLVFGIFAIIASLISRTGNLPHNVAQIWGKSILWVSGVRVTVTGSENLDPGRSYIYMSNHQSNFDIPALLGHLPVQFRWLAKSELFKIPLFSRSMRGCGYISIDRSNRKAAFESLRLAAETIRNGTSVVIFPEGTRSPDGKIQRFKKGGFVMAVDAGVPIVPIVITGTFSIMPKNQLMIRPGPITIHLNAPIETKDYTRSTKDELMDRIHNIMSEKDDRRPEEGLA